MKRNIFFIAATALALLGLSSCNNEIDGNVNRDEQAQLDTTRRSTFICETTPTTRATLVWHSGTTNNGAAVHWEVGDQIWVYESFTNRIGSTGSDITATKPNACFYFPWLFRADSYKVNYFGHPSNTDGKGVTIKGQVWQSYADQTDHLKYYGDCAVATATKVKTGQYLVGFTHLPAFLNILPYSTNALIRGGMVLKKVVIKSSNPLTGVFPDVGSYGLDLGHATNTGKQIEIFLNNGNGFAVDNDQVNQWRNGIYCVMVPGWHDLTIEYYCTSPITSMPLKFIKIIGAQNYAPNTITNITADLSVMEFDLKYYFPFAAEGYDIFRDRPAPIYNPGVSDERQSVSPYFNYRSINVERAIRTAPNINQVAWYLANSYADKTTPWMLNGVLHRGGLWVPKLSYLATYKGYTVEQMAIRDPSGVNRTIPSAASPKFNNKEWVISNLGTIVPTSHTYSNYFFLPACGYYVRDSPTSQNMHSESLYSYYWLLSPHESVNYHSEYTTMVIKFQLPLGNQGGGFSSIRATGLENIACPFFNAQ